MNPFSWTTCRASARHSAKNLSGRARGGGVRSCVGREERENALKHFRNSEANDTLAQQVAYKRAHEVPWSA